jgi:ABC-type glycerol-3-phosphate transport system substrate-binding protein
MQGVIADYESLNPGVKINYTMQSPKNYRTRFLAAGTSEGAPDIVRIHNTWLPMLKKDLSPAPDNVLKTSDLSGFYPIVQRDFVSAGKIYALPMGIDGLALIYNEDILKESGATPPSDWNSLRKLAFDLTKTNPETKIIERAGVAMGTTGNVDHWSDILGLLILQNSGNPANPSETAVQDALTFYTIISTQDKAWDASQPNSIYAFATGTVAMILAPSWQVSEIKAINPNLNFKVAPAPVLPSANYAWATYWGEAVLATSKNQTEAWKFIKYLTSSESLQKTYAGASQIRALGEPYPLTSLSSSLSSDPLASAYVTQGANYKSWYLADRTFDDGINDGISKYYEDAINAINNGSTVAAVLKPLDEGVKQLLLKYPEAK